jgi:hypothetical protein
MLDRIESRTFDEWLAYRKLEPEPLRAIQVTLRLGFSALCRAWGMDVSPDAFDASQATKHDEQEVSPEQGAAIVSQALGASRGNGNW